MDPRRYVVYGAGAVGGALGGMLQRSGRDVTFVARGAQLDALAQRGLTLALPSREVHVAARAVASARAVAFGSRDVIVLATKSQDTVGALRDLAASAPRDVPIVCAQNGVANEPRAAALFDRVYGLVVFALLQFFEPGRVSVHSEPILGGLDLGLYPAGLDDLAHEIVGDLTGAGFDARAEPRILRLKYGKLLSNLTNALQALGGSPALESPLVTALEEEATRVLRAAGIDFTPPEELQARYANVRELPVADAPRLGGSSLQSLARGTGTIEADFLNGEIVRLGHACGVATPRNAALVELARRAAIEAWPPAKLSVAEIEAAIDERRPIVRGIPDYRDLDRTNEAGAAAERMEARARELASEAMFRELVCPLVTREVKRVLEIGCGTGALARRIARAAPWAEIVAIDKSEGMLGHARSLARGEAIEFGAWEVNDEKGWPFDARPFDLILSSVVVPYLSDDETESLVGRLVRRLAPGGTLAFVEQDLMSDSVSFPSFDLFRRVEAKDERVLKRTLALGLRPLLRSAGLTLLPRKSFLWTDDAYGSYAREMLGRVADDALRLGRITEQEREAWSQTLDALAADGDFYYGLVYHRIAGTRC